jgi:hypothetical protein
MGIGCFKKPDFGIYDVLISNFEIIKNPSKG